MKQTNIKTFYHSPTSHFCRDPNKPTHTAIPSLVPMISFPTSQQNSTQKTLDPFYKKVCKPSQKGERQNHTKIPPKLP